MFENLDNVFAACNDLAPHGSDSQGSPQNEEISRVKGRNTHRGTFWNEQSHQPAQSISFEPCLKPTYPYDTTFASVVSDMNFGTGSFSSNQPQSYSTYYHCAPSLA